MLVLNAFLSLQPSMFLGQVAVSAQRGLACSLACAVACGAIANAGVQTFNAIYFIAVSARIYWVTAYFNA